MGWPFKNKESDTPVDKPNEQSAADADALIAKFGEVLDARLKPIQDEVSSVKSKWDALEATAKQAEDAEAARQRAENPPAPLTDHEKVLLAGLADVKGTQIERDLIDEIRDEWPDLVPILRAEFAKTAPAVKARADYAQYCRNVKTWKLGELFEKQGGRYDRTKRTLYLGDESSSKTPEGTRAFDETMDYVYTDNKGQTHRESFEQQLAKLDIDPKKFIENAEKGRLS
jgi:hypothetical protein